MPFATELRKVLFRFGQFKQRASVGSDLMFPARDGGKWELRNASRSYYCLLKSLALPQSGFHLLRHTFATQYLRSGGDLVRLSLILGHTEVGTTQKYLHLLTEDLHRPHQGLSILNRLRQVSGQAGEVMAIIPTVRCRNMTAALNFYTGVLDFSRTDSDDMATRIAPRSPSSPGGRSAVLVQRDR